MRKGKFIDMFLTYSVLLIVVLFFLTGGLDVKKFAARLWGDMFFNRTT